MKKLIYSSIFILSLFSFIACDKDETESVESTNVTETETNSLKSESSITRASSIDGQYTIEGCDGGPGYGFFTVSTVNGRVQARGQFDFIYFTIYGRLNSKGNYVFNWQESALDNDPRTGVKSTQVRIYISEDKSKIRGSVRNIRFNGEIEITNRYCK